MGRQVRMYAFSECSVDRPSHPCLDMLIGRRLLLRGHLKIQAPQNEYHNQRNPPSISAEVRHLPSPDHPIQQHLRCTSIEHSFSSVRRTERGAPCGRLLVLRVILARQADIIRFPRFLWHSAIPAAQLTEGTQFCSKCGAPIAGASGSSASSADAPSPPPLRPPAPSSALKTILIIVGAIVLIGVVGIATLTFIGIRVARHTRVMQEGDHVKVETPFGTAETSKDPDAGRQRSRH